MATKEEIHKIVNDAKWGYVATCDSGQPRVRPMSVFADEDLVFWVATGSSSRKVQQIKGNPKVELCYCAPSGAHIRCSGSMEIVEDRDKKEWFFKSRDYMEKYFSGPDDPKYALLRLAPDKIEAMLEGKMEYEDYAP